MKASHGIASAAAALVVLAAASGVAPAREREALHQVYETGSQPRLSFQNINGDLTIEGWDENRIDVTATKSADSKQRLEDVDVRFRMDNDHLRIEVKYQDDDDWRDGGHVSVDFTIRLPRGAGVDAVELVNGDVEIRNIEGDIDVSSVNGEVTGERLGGDVELSTVNGQVSLVAGGGIDSIRMNSVNGDVELVLPKKFDARISAGTVHGDIIAIDGLDVDATGFTGSSMRGTLGKGGLKVDLNTVNGSIQIRREGESGARERE